MRAPSWITPVLLALAACGGGGGGSSSGSTPPTATRLYAQECAGAESFVSQSDPAPSDRSFMRVQHIGDAGTAEQAGQVSRPVTWDVGTLTGLHALPSQQRGFRDEPPPVAASAFQLSCDGAGFLINSFQFAHRLPLVGEGPSITFGRVFDPGLAFGRGIAMTVDLRLPHMVAQSQPVIADGTAQVGFVYYLRDTRSQAVVAFLVALYENRLPGTNGAGVESLGHDGVNAFVTSPLLANDASGKAVEYVTPPSGEAMRFGAPWADAKRFRAVVTEAQLRRALAALRVGDSRLSAEPADYRLTLFGVLAEVFPGTGDANNVALGGSVSGLALDSL